MKCLVAKTYFIIKIWHTRIILVPNSQAMRQHNMWLDMCRQIVIMSMDRRDNFQHVGTWLSTTSENLATVVSIWTKLLQFNSNRPCVLFKMDPITDVIDDLDFEKLIDVVRSHPAIWNTSHSDYSDKIKKENSWDEVCKSFYNETWDNLSTNL